MRKLIFAINTTLDGVVDHMKIGPPDQETGEYFIRLTRDAGTFLYGRKTYQLMVPFWPDRAKNPSGQTTAGYEFAQPLTRSARLLFSPDHWTALKRRKRALFVRAFETKYLT